MKCLASVISALCLFASSAQANERFISNSNLYESCTSESEKFLCQLFVIAIYEGFTIGHQEAYMRHNNQRTFDIKKLPEVMRLCHPQNTTTDDFVEAYKDYMSRNSQYVHHNAGPTVVFALREAYPCK